MSINSGYTLTGEQVAEIFNVRLAPYLPAHLTKVDPQTYFIRYTFEPFTGREPEPTEPDYQRICDDPKLCHQHWDEEAGRPVADKAEYKLRRAAEHLLRDVYQAAHDEWLNARHVADLKATVKDTDALWKAHNQAKRAVEAAFAYLREPDAAKEWPSAVSRLVDTQDTYQAAALAFDDRALEIARVHEKYRHEESLGYHQALTAAGYPEGKHWHITSTDSYGRSYNGEYDTHTLAGRAQDLIKQQNEHVAKVGRLCGETSAR